MRKSQKKQLENMLELLDKAQDAIRKAIETKNSEIALSLLEQCQDSAIQIGSMIEESFGEDFVTVGLLENYCEQIYQTYELIRQKHPVNANKTYKFLRKELIRIENSVKNDIQVRTTAVFLPYKASMWDSLESVWKAADDDPNCDAYVVPIPYFDKNPDGSFREMHYEGDDYPKYVPITSWEEYDIAAEHPDMIFIHNPYDEFNLVTSVPPAYYAKELKKCTDKLIYIPYFILNEIEPDNKQAVKGIEHFCAVPAVVYADRVIVQSNKMRQIYIDVMSETMGEDTKKIWEMKILGIGSPKIEKICGTHKADLCIPEEWKEIIEKPDGEWKKIVFYNTSVSALLQQDEKMLRKIENVFDVFRKKQNEMALLWRPHPLIRATIEAMRPQLWREYEELVRKYHEENWGIYDDTADVDRAIALSDAYYGDTSSLVQMFCEIGKPVMIQGLKNELNMSKEKLQINFLAGVQVGNDILFSAWNINGLFQYNPQTAECVFLKCFLGEGNWGLHSEAILYGKEIWFIPRASERIAIVDLDSLEIDYLDLPQSGYRMEGAHIPPRRMTACHEKGEKFLWLIPFAYKLFLKIDMEKRRIIEVQEWGKEEFPYATAVKLENKLWINLRTLREVRIIDLKSGYQTDKKIGREGIDYLYIHSNGERIFLFPKKMEEGILMLDFDMQECGTAYLNDGGQQYYEYQALTEAGDMLLVPYAGKRSVRIRVKDDECFVKGYEDLQVKEDAFCATKINYDDQIWFLSHVAGKPIVCYQDRDGVFEYRYIVIDREAVKESISYAMQYNFSNGKKVFDEQSNDFLDEYILYIKDMKSGEQEQEERHIGEKIYRAL